MGKNNGITYISVFKPMTVSLNFLCFQKNVTFIKISEQLLEADIDQKWDEWYISNQTEILTVQKLYNEALQINGNIQV